MPTTSIQDLYNHLKTLNKQWFYDKPEIDALLDAKLDEVEVPTSTSDLTNDSNFISTSETTGLIKNDGSIDTNSYLTASDISNKVNESDLATVATTGSYSDLENIPQSFTPSPHEHSSADMKDSNAHANIGTSANANQSAINTAIDTKLGALLSAELVVLEASLPQASQSTMNKLYLIPETDVETNDAYQVFITVESGNSYSWEKLDTAKINLTNYVTTSDARLSDARTPLSHTHGNVSNDGKIGSDTGKVVVTTTGGTLATSDWVTEVDNVIQQLTTYGSNL